MNSIIDFFIKLYSTDKVLSITVLSLTLLSIITYKFGFKLIENIYNNIFNLIVKRKRLYSHIKTDTSDSIYEQIVELRALMNCEKTFLWEFHNGSTFASNNPIWRLSETFSYSTDNYKSNFIPKDIFISNIWLSIKQFLNNTGKDLPPGFYDGGTYDECPMKQKKCNKELIIYKIVTEELKDDNFKDILLKNGVKIAYATIVNKFGHPVAIIGCYYLSEEDIKEQNGLNKFSTCHLCKCSQKISLLK